MKDSKAEIIHEYEELKNIPEEFRFTEYVEAYDSHMIKMGLALLNLILSLAMDLLLKKQNNNLFFKRR